MKTLIKPFLVILFLAMAGGGIYLYILLQKAKEKKAVSPIEQAAKEQVQTKAEIIAKEVDQNGVEHTVAKMAKEFDNASLAKARADLLDTTDALNIERDKVKQVIAINTSLVIKNQSLQRKITDVATLYTHNDDHFRLAINIPLDSSKTATFDAGYDAELITTQYNKNKWLFWNDDLIDIYSNDPRFTIKGARTLTIKPKPALMGFSVDGIANNNQITGLSAGAGARIRIGRFTFNGSYQYYHDFDRFAFDYGMKYRLIGTD